QMRAGLDSDNNAPHRLIGDVTQAPGLDGRGADVEHAARIAVVTVFDHRYVDIDDVAALELFVAGYAVTHDMIYGSAYRRRIRLVSWRRVVECRRHDMLHVDLVVVGDAVELAGGNAGFDVRREVIEQLRCQASGHAHLGDFVGALDRYSRSVRATHAGAIPR